MNSRFSANLSLLFTEFELLDRFAEASAAGFDAVEIQFPYGTPPKLLREAADNAGIDIVLINVPAGDLMQGGAGLACVPEKVQAYRQALDQCVEYARILKPQCVNVLAGRVEDPGVRSRCYQTFLANLEYTAEKLSSLNIRTVFEAINTYDMPGFLVNNCDQAMEIVKVINRPDVAMQFDVYHMDRMGEPVPERIRELVDRVGHIQIADNPGRHQPGSGRIDFDTVFAAIEESGYRGWVGAEYNPAGDTGSSLDWLKTRHRR